MLTTQWFSATINPDLINKSQVWVAYSGGVDSHVLLDLARRSFPNIRAIHINHGISDLDDQWQKHCEMICDELGIFLKCIRVNVQVNHGASQENILRIARRDAWCSVLQENDVLLLGHHADDQAETVLYRLLRGAGPNGLSGIKFKANLGGITLLRPLLGVSKQQILEYSESNKINWLQDQTNYNSNFDRNYIRNNVLPLILQRWPAAINSINRASDLCNSSSKLIKHQASEKLQDMLLQDNILDITKLSKEILEWQCEILRQWLQNFAIIPSSEQLKIICSEVIAARVDAQPRYQIANKVLKRSNNKLYLLDNITSAASKHGRKAKKIFQKYGIPPWERVNYPLVFDGDKLVAITGLWSRT